MFDCHPDSDSASDTDGDFGPMVNVACPDRVDKDIKWPLKDVAPLERFECIAFRNFPSSSMDNGHILWTS